MSLYDKLKIIGVVTKERGPAQLVAQLAKFAYSTSEVYVLRRDLAVPLKPRPKAKVPITVRPLETSDISQIEAEGPSGLLTGIVRSGLPGGYVAVTENKEICFLQWLITPETRERIRKLRFRQMHAFDDDTVMLEFSYAFKRFRGLGIMAPAVAWVAEQHPRARWAVTYVERNNIPSLRGCLNQHHPCGRSALAHGVEVSSYGFRPVGILISQPLVSHCLVDLYMLPIGVEFVGEHHRQRGANDGSHL